MLTLTPKDGYHRNFCFWINRVQQKFEFHGYVIRRGYDFSFGRDGAIQMDSPDLPDKNYNDEEWLMATLKRISAAAEGSIENQVNREIVRYWNDRVRDAGGNADEIRRIRVEISQLIQDV